MPQSNQQNHINLIHDYYGNSLTVIENKGRNVPSTNSGKIAPQPIDSTSLTGENIYNDEIPVAVTIENQQNENDSQQIRASLNQIISEYQMTMHQ